MAAAPRTLPDGPGPHRAPPRPRLATVALVAATLSGAPSTAWALATGGDVWAATRAAGALVPGGVGRGSRLAGAAAHVAISAGWVAVLAAAARRRPFGPVGGAVAGLAIAALDLGVVGRRVPAVRALPVGAQVADHVAFGAIVGAGLRRRART